MTTETEVAQIIANLRQCVEASEAKDKYIKQLEMQADRIRAQIAAKDAAHPCKDGCQYAMDVGMWPNYSCENGCQYDKADEAAQARIRSLEAQIAAKDAEISHLRRYLKAASHALRSYQYGNSATDLAEDIANGCDAALAAKGAE